MSILPNKGDLSDPNKWRGISVLSCMLNIISSVIANCLGKYFLGVGLEEQCGGVFQKGCINGTLNVKQYIHILKQQQKYLWAISADLEKSYDTVDRLVIRQILRRYSVPNALISVLSKLYSEVFINIKCCGNNVSIPSNVGIKQGDNLAPIIFSSSSTLWKSPYHPSGNGPESNIQ